MNLLHIVMLLLVFFYSQGVFPEDVVDDLGRTLSLSEPAMRVVTLAPHLTEIYFDLGLGDKVVGTVEFSDYPEAAKKIIRVGNAFTVSVEAIIQLQPDLVVVWGSGGQAHAIKKLRSLGIPVYSSEPATIQGIPLSASHLATLSGEPESGARLKSAFDQRLGEFKAGIGSGLRPLIFLQISEQGLYTVNDKHLIGQAISWCGGRNVFGDLDIPVPLVSMEAIIEARPQLIIYSSRPSIDDRWKDKWQKYDSIPAVAGNHLYRIDADLLSRPGYRLLDGISELCELLTKHRTQALHAQIGSGAIPQ